MKTGKGNKKAQSATFFIVEKKKAFLSGITLAFPLTAWLGPPCWRPDFAPQFCRSLETGFFSQEEKSFTLPFGGA